MLKLYFRKILLGLAYGAEFCALYALAALALKDFAPSTTESSSIFDSVTLYFLLFGAPFLITLTTATVLRIKNEDASNIYQKDINSRQLSLKEDILYTINASHFRAEIMAFATYLAFVGALGARLFWAQNGILGIFIELGWYILVVLVYSIFDLISWLICHKIWDRKQKR